MLPATALGEKLKDVKVKKSFKRKLPKWNFDSCCEVQVPQISVTFDVSLQIVGQHSAARRLSVG